MSEFSLIHATPHIVCITGAATGIGQAIAQAFAKNHNRLILLDKNPAVHQLAQDLNHADIKHLSYDIDLCDLNELSRVMDEAIVQTGGRIDALINNAGVAIIEPAVSTLEKNWDLTMTINTKVPLFLAQMCLPIMQKQGKGHIVNLASQASVVALDGHAAYCASKAALVSLTKVMALEWGRFGVTVNAVSPTVVATDLGKAVWSGEKGDRLKAQIPMGRFATPEEVADLVVFLASDRAAMIHGENILIDGGYSIA